MEICLLYVMKFREITLNYLLYLFIFTITVEISIYFLGNGFFFFVLYFCSKVKSHQAKMS